MREFEAAKSVRPRRTRHDIESLWQTVEYRKAERRNAVADAKAARRAIYGSDAERIRTERTRIYGERK